MGGENNQTDAWERGVNGWDDGCKRRANGRRDGREDYTDATTEVRREKAGHRMGKESTRADGWERRVNVEASDGRGANGPTDERGE